MIDKAIEKITKEMMKLNDPFAQAIEEYLTGLCTDEAVAEKLLNPDKNLSEACEAVREVARKNQKNGVGCVSDAEAYKIVKEYFGITEKDKKKKLDVLDLL